MNLENPNLENMLREAENYKVEDKSSVLDWFNNVYGLKKAVLGIAAVVIPSTMITWERYTEDRQNFKDYMALRDTTFSQQINDNFIIMKQENEILINSFLKELKDVSNSRIHIYNKPSSTD